MNLSSKLHEKNLKYSSMKAGAQQSSRNRKKATALLLMAMAMAGGEEACIQEDPCALKSIPGRADRHGRSMRAERCAGRDVRRDAARAVRL